MTFILTEEQTMLKEAATAFIADRMPVSFLRGLRDNGHHTGFDRKLWQDMSDMGWAGVVIDETHGGSGFGYVGMGQVLEAQGRNLAPSPLLQTGLIVPTLLAKGASAAQQDGFLPDIASGAEIYALAIDETAHHHPEQIALRAEAAGDHYILTGTKRYVVSGAIADKFIIAARTSGVPRETAGISLFRIARDAPGLTVQDLTTVDAHGAANLILEGVNSAELIGEEGDGWSALEAALDAGRIGLAAEMIGTMDGAFAMLLDYLNTRKQFGQLIGSFQALQHRAASLFAEIEMTRSCVADALSALDQQKTEKIPELASLAKARAGETLHLLSNELIQMHGGIGMTDVHDSGLYLKRARVQETLLGGESYHRDRFAKLNGF
jgi:alkylation response protein AidB-like acyl-CoA dehydrogenase